DIEERFHFNTAISAVMELVNEIGGLTDQADPDTVRVMRHALEAVALLLSPITPHFSEELWSRLGSAGSILETPWPEFREEVLVTDEILVVVQVNGKLRGKFTAPAEADKDLLRERALACEPVQKFIADKTIKKVIVVPGKLVNIVV
ncbi:MAG: class I tRNA ligase family protein, partial [Desulfosudaceae bacterium]